MKKTILFLDIFLLIGCLGIILMLVSIKNTFIEINSQTECINQVGYYRCGGTRKNPKYCSIKLEE